MGKRGIEIDIDIYNRFGVLCYILIHIQYDIIIETKYNLQFNNVNTKKKMNDLIQY